MPSHARASLACVIGCTCASLLYWATTSGRWHPLQVGRLRERAAAHLSRASAADAVIRPLAPEPPSDGAQPLPAPAEPAIAAAPNASSPTGGSFEPASWLASTVRDADGAQHARLRNDTLDEYVELHNAIVSAPRDSSHVAWRGQQVPRRFIIVRPCCQLCNRVRVLVSALVLGVLTSRAVLMDFDGGYYGRLLDMFSPRVQLATFSTPRPEKSLAWEHMLHDFLCTDALGPGLSSVPTVVLSGSPCFMHVLHLNPSLRHAFTRAFGSAEGLFAAVVSRVLPVSDDVAGQLSAAHAQIQAAAAQAGARGAGGASPPGAPSSPRPFIVGVHVRNGRDFRSNKLTPEQWAQLAQCARDAVPAHRAAEAVWYVATDGEESRHAARAAFGEAVGASRVVIFPGFAHGKSCRGDNCSVSRAGAVYSLVELMLLARCDLRILTPMSSFSETAAALSARRGVYFHPDRQRKFHYESAVEVLPHCLVPFTAEMPGSMQLSDTLRSLPCGRRVQKLDDSAWSHPFGLRFLDNSSALPVQLARRHTRLD